MMTRSSILSATTLLALTSLASAADMSPVYTKAPPPPPLPQASGYVEVYSGFAWTKDETSNCSLLLSPCSSETLNFDGWVLGGAGRGNYWFWPNASVQVDAQAEGTSNHLTSDSASSGHFSTHSYLVGGHVNWRDPQRGLLGIFGGAGDAGGAGLTFFASSQRHGVIGGEGQLYWNQFTFYLQGGYDSTIGNVDFTIDNVHAWFVRGTGRWYATPNLLLEATGLYANGQVDFANVCCGDPASLGFNTWLWQAKLEWRPRTIPFSLFAKYQGTQTRYDTLTIPGEATFDQKKTDSRFLIGARLYMGEGTLLANDRHGATLDIIDPLGTPVSPLMFAEPPRIAMGAQGL